MLRIKNYVLGKQDILVPAHLNFGKYVLDRLTDSDEIAIGNIVTKDTLTYRELKVNAMNYAVSLFKLGIKKGDVIAVGTETRKECMPLTLGVICAGAILTTYDMTSGRVSFKHKIETTKPKYFIGSKMFLERYHNTIKEFDCVKVIMTIDDSFDDIKSLKDVTIEEFDMELFEPVLVSGNDVAMILFSSGTTGLCKGLGITHLSSILESFAEDFSNNKSVQVACFVDEWHGHYATWMAFQLLMAAKQIWLSDRWVTDNVLRGIQEYKANIIFILPSFVSLLLKEGDMTKYNLESLKIIYSSASSLHKETIQTLKQRFPKVELIHQAYGMTEVGSITSAYCDQKGLKEESVGKAVPSITLKVVDVNTRQALGPNQRGEICVRGPKIMSGYIGIDSSNYFDEEDFLKSGDLGYYDEECCFYIVGRIKDNIDNDGYSVFPAEIETILQLHPGVQDVGVVGKPDPHHVEVPVAFVVKEPGVAVTGQELVDYMAQEPIWLHIRGGVRFIEEIPRNTRGKILRQALKEMLNTRVD